jgi:hypothetical protein
VIFTHFATPPTIPDFYRAQCVSREREKEGGKGKLECPIYLEKNRDTGGVTCMELYVGNTPPNELFLLWDVCFMCFLGAVAKHIVPTVFAGA